MKRISIFLGIIVSLIIFNSCGSSKSTPSISINTMNLALVKTAQSNKYVNLEYGIRLNVKDERSNTKIIQKYDASAIYIPTVRVNPEIISFVSESSRRYMRTMGFNLDADVATDYMMQIDLTDFNVNWLSGVGWSATVKMDIEVYDQNRNLVYPSVVVTGRANQYSSSTDFTTANNVLNTAYANALEDIDWDRIAFFLNRASSPKEEATKTVKGEGNTALEHLVIHWNVNSRPQGADVYWRVISQTPEVKNQNYKYLETTPYESTETLNIKGLTYNNAGNVQIEIKCEKNGYYSRTKKYSVLSIIDDSDVSYMFNLVKEEE